MIDTRGLWKASINLDHIDFAAISGEVTIGRTMNNGLGNQYLVADGHAQTLNTGDGDDVVHAGGDDDAITGGAGDDWIDGGAGNDTVRLAGVRADYTMRVEQGHVVIAARGGEEGSDAVANVELLNFGGAGFDASLLDISASLLAQSSVDDALTNDDFVRALFTNGADRSVDLKELS